MAGPLEPVTLVTVARTACSAVLVRRWRTTSTVQVGLAYNACFGLASFAVILRPFVALVSLASFAVGLVMLEHTACSAGLVGEFALVGQVRLAMEHFRLLKSYQVIDWHLVG